MLQNIGKISYMINCLKVTFLKNLHHTQTIQLISTVDHLANLTMIQILSRKDYSTDYGIATH